MTPGLAQTHICHTKTHIKTGTHTQFSLHAACSIYSEKSTQVHPACM